jgi:hypothetical protein
MLHTTRQPDNLCKQGWCSEITAAYEAANWFDSGTGHCLTIFAKLVRTCQPKRHTRFKYVHAECSTQHMAHSLTVE